MSIRISCEFCEAKLNVRADKLGKPLKCPSCRNMISAAANTPIDQDSTSVQFDSAASEESPEGSDGFNFAEEFDLEGLLDEPVSDSDDLSRMPPARKPSSRAKKGKAKTATSEVPASSARPRSHCAVCRKQLDSGVRYCTGCGHNNFDAEAAAVDAHLKIQTRMERLSASLGVARILKIFSRMFR